MEKEEKVALTPKAYDSLKDQLQHLEEESRTYGNDRRGKVGTSGRADASEIDEIGQQRALREAQAGEIRDIMENAEIIRAEGAEVVEPGKLVTVRYGDEDESESYRVELRQEGEHPRDVLSPASPLCRALMGHSPGERVQVKVPAGEVEVEIVDVRTP